MCISDVIFNFLFLSLRLLTGILLANIANDLPIHFNSRVSEPWYAVYLVPQENTDYLQEASKVTKYITVAAEFWVNMRY